MASQWYPMTRPPSTTACSNGLPERATPNRRINMDEDTIREHAANHGKATVAGDFKTAGRGPHPRGRRTGAGRHESDADET